jgi:hypothetical protein
MVRNSSPDEGGVVGTAITSLERHFCRKATMAARIVEPVAIPSSTKMIVFPLTCGGGA